MPEIHDINAEQDAPNLTPKVTTAGKSSSQMLEERKEIIENARAHMEEQGDSWSAEDAARWEQQMCDADHLEAAAKRTRKLEILEGSVSDDAPAASRVPSNPSPATAQVPAGRGRQVEAPRTILLPEGRDASGRVAYKEYAVGHRGSAKYQGDFTNFLGTGQTREGMHIANDTPGGSGKQYMALQSDNASQAGYLLASEQFASHFLKEVDDLLFIRRWARRHVMREASSLGIRCRKERMNTWAWSQELVNGPEDTSLKYGKRSLTPHHASGSVQLSRDLVRRSMGGAEAEIRYEMARDAGELMEDGYLVGDGNQKPLGVFTASTDGIGTGRDVKSGVANDFGADGLIDAKYHLKAQYRTGQRGPLRWLFNRTAINRIAKLKDNDGQYLFRVGVGFAADNTAPEDSLLGYPVDESERAPSDYSNGNYGGLLANWNYYEIVDALDMEIQALVELRALTNQYMYVGRLKTDGMPTLEEAFVRIEMGT